MTDVENSTTTPTEAISSPDSPLKARSATLYRAPSTGLLPSYVRLLALLGALAALWLVAEAFWPDRRIVSLNLAPVAASEGATVETSLRDPDSFNTLFAYRKLFIPEVAVESRETSRATVQQLLEKLTLSGLVETDAELSPGDLSAWVQVREGATATSSSTRYASRATSSTTRATTLKLVKKGDMLLDFEVVEITRDGVTLSLAGFTETLR